MDKAKIARLSAAIVILAIAGVLIARSVGGGGPDLADKAQLVCVVTGETFVRDIDDVLMYPAKHPETGERTLVPYYVDDAGEARIDRHYASVVERLKDVNKVVDPVSLRVDIKKD